MITKKRISDARLKANQENAKKSTGPRTPAGKAISSKNALVHGLTSDDVTTLGEDYAFLPAAIEAFRASWNPQTPYEENLVRNLAVIQLRLDRCVRMETGLFDPGIGHVSPSDSRPTINSAIAHAFGDRMEKFNTLSRYEAGLFRAYEKTFKLLLATRKEKLAPRPVTINCRYETNPKTIENMDSFSENKPNEPTEATEANAANPAEPIAAPPQSANPSSRRSGGYKAPPPPPQNTVELLWVDLDGNPLDFSPTPPTPKEPRP